MFQTFALIFAAIAFVVAVNEMVNYFKEVGK